MEDTEISPEGKFNFAIDTLMRISGILREIKIFSIAGIEGTIPRGKAQHLVYESLYQLHLAAYPLYSEDIGKRIELSKDIKNKLLGIKMENHSEYEKDGKLKEINAKFNPGIDIELKKLQERIEELIQSSGRYFMPKGRGEPTLMGYSNQ